MRTIGASASTTQPSQVPNDGPAGIDSEPGTWRRACLAGDRVSTTTAPRPSAVVQPGAEQRLDGRDARAQESRSGLVDRPHPREVARDRRLPGQQRPREGLHLHRRQERVVAALVADGRPRRRGDPGRAQRPGAVGRVDHDRVLVRQQDVVERAVHRLRERPGVVRPEQVGPPDRADQQRAAGQEQERLVAAGRVGDRVADVLRRVARACPGSRTGPPRRRTRRRRVPGGARGRGRRRRR